MEDTGDKSILKPCTEINVMCAMREIKGNELNENRVCGLDKQSKA